MDFMAEKVINLKVGSSDVIAKYKWGKKSVTTTTTTTTTTPHKFVYGNWEYGSNGPFK